MTQKSITKPALLVIAPDKFRDEELSIPKQALEMAGIPATVVSTKTGAATGMLGDKQPVWTTIDHVEAANFSALIIVGGVGAVEHLWPCEALHALAQEFFKQGKITSAICVSPAILASAGLLTGKKATVWDSPETQKIFADHSVTYVDAPVVQDGLLITGQRPEASTAFAQAIVSAMLARV